MYNVRWRLDFTDELGTSKRLDVLQEEYAGSVIDVIGAGAPVFTSMEQSGDNKYAVMKGTEIDFQVYSETDFQFLNDIKGAKEREFQVRLYEGSTLVHAGYVIPQIYTEPYTVTPYASTIRAVALGALQGIPYKDGNNFYEGRETQLTVLLRCLNKLDFGFDLWDSINTVEDSMIGTAPLEEIEVDQDSYIFTDRGRKKALSCYDVVERILSPYVVNLVQDDGAWKIIPIDERGGSRTVRRYDSSGSLQETFAHDPQDSDYIWLRQDQGWQAQAAIEELETVYDHGLIPNLVGNFDFNDGFESIDKGGGTFIEVPNEWDLNAVGDWGGSIFNPAIKRVACSIENSGPSALFLNSDEIADGAFVEYEGDNIEREAGDALFLSFFYAPETRTRQISGINRTPELELDIPIEVRIGTNYLTSSGAWTSTATQITLRDLGDGFSGYTTLATTPFTAVASGFRRFEIASEPIPDDGVLLVRIFKPISENEGSSLGDSIAVVAVTEFSVEYFPSGQPQTKTRTFVGERDIESFAESKRIDLFHGDGPTNIHPASLTISGSKTSDWTRGALTGGIAQIATRKILSEYQQAVGVIRGSRRTSKRFDAYISDQGVIYSINSGSYDERFCEFSGEHIQVFNTNVSSTVSIFDEQQTGSTSGVGGRSPVGDFDDRYLRIVNNLGDVQSVSEARTNLDVYSTGEVDGFVEDVNSDIVKLRLADESLMQRKAEAGLNVEAGDGLSGGGLLTDDIELNVEVDDSTIEIDGNLRVKDEGITEAKLADDSVSTDKIIDGNVTNAKLANSTISGKGLGTNLDSLSAGNGLTGTAYNGSTPRTFAVGTPSTLTVSSTNSTTSTSHNHALDLSGRTLTLADDSDGVITFPANAQNLGANRTWTPSIASHGDDQRGTLDPTAQNIYGDKTFEDEVLFKDLHKADNFALTTDFTGTGWEGTHAGDFNIRNLVVREAARFRELIIDQLSAVGGSFLYSAARGKVESRDGNVITLEDPNDKGVSQFAVNDIFVVRVVDIDGGEVKFVTGRVSAVSGVEITLAQDISNTSGNISDISTGDVIVQRGNTTDALRQNAIYVTATDSDSPSQKYFTGLDSIDAFNQESNIVVQSGNLANITNATGFGFYGENTFLTGSLLVGDLTKVGNYLEYDGTELNVFANEINLTAVGDVGSSVLTLQSDLIDLFLREESSYAGIQFLAGQLILSASDIDGQGRVKLAQIRLDATGEESVVGIQADAFLLETNNLLIDSAAANNGKIALGSNPTGITVANIVAGTILDGDGNLKAYTNPSNFLRKDSTGLEIRSTKFQTSTQGLLIDSESSTVESEVSFGSAENTSFTLDGPSSGANPTFQIATFTPVHINRIFRPEFLEVEIQTTAGAKTVSVNTFFEARRTGESWVRLTGGLTPIDAIVTDGVNAIFNYAEAALVEDPPDIRNEYAFFAGEEWDEFRIYVEVLNVTNTDIVDFNIIDFKSSYNETTTRINRAVTDAMFLRSFALDMLYLENLNVKSQLRLERDSGGTLHLYAYFFEANGFSRKVQIT